MKRILVGVAMVVPFITVGLIINQTVEIISFKKSAAPFRKSLDSLSVTVKLAEQASKLSFGAKSLGSNAVSPFKPDHVEIIPVVSSAPQAIDTAPVDTFNREVLEVQGIMKGAKPMAVLADKNGVTYVVKVGQVLFDRTVTAISSNGVTLKDHSGAETIAIP